MPRLPPRLLNTARRQHPFLALILQETRDLPSAGNELRWLAEDAFSHKPDHHASVPCNGAKLTIPKPPRSSSQADTSISAGKLYANVLRRSRGEPLQYILGSTPFGDLDILCRPDVLIPRWETEGYVQRVAERVLSSIWIRKREAPLRILDLCTGSGCIALLLHSLLRPVGDDGKAGLADKRGSGGVRVTALDYSNQALDLARENLDHNVQLGHLHPAATDEIEFVHGDILALADAVREPDKGTTAKSNASRLILDQQYDLVISNPPYISLRQFSAHSGMTSRSVRKYEPKIALVPPPPSPAPVHSSSNSASTSPHPHTTVRSATDPDDGDTFYPAILTIARAVQVKCIVMEIGDAAQVARVAELASSHYHQSQHNSDESVVIEVWNDDGERRRFDEEPSASSITEASSRTLEARHNVVEVAEDRAVVVWLKASHCT